MLIDKDPNLNQQNNVSTLSCKGKTWTQNKGKTPLPTSALVRPHLQWWLLSALDPTF